MPELVTAVRVSISIRDPLAGYVLKAIHPDEPSGVRFEVSGDVLALTAVFDREAKARAWIESESRLISTILKTLNQSLL